MQKEPEETAGVWTQGVSGIRGLGGGPQDSDPQQYKAWEKRENHRTLTEVTRVKDT